MSTSLRIIACVTAAAVLFSGCSKVVRSHRSFMDGLKTKADVTHYFGYPAQYQELGDTSKWLYDLSRQQRINRHNPYPFRSNHSFQESKMVRIFNYPDKYLEVILKQDSVVYSHVAGANYTLRKPQPLKTVLLVVVLLGIGVAIMSVSYVPIDGPIFSGF